jgi:lipase ATG15
MQSHTKQRNSWTTFSRALFVTGIFAQVVLLALIVRSWSSDDVSSGPAPIVQPVAVEDPNSKVLRLRHIIHHGAGQRGPRAVRLDISPERVAIANAEPALAPVIIKTSPVEIERPAIRPYNAQIPMSPIWVAEDILGPDVEDKDTIITFANMSENAYKVGRDDSGWMDVDEQYNSSIPFGWDDSGIRGHVFGDDTNSTIILAVKGTTVAMFEGNGTSVHDKENDNLFGSCCCGQGGTYLWSESLQRSEFFSR